jgi:hypothetical protein
MAVCYSLSREKYKTSETLAAAGSAIKHEAGPRRRRMNINNTLTYQFSDSHIGERCFPGLYVR